MRQTLKNKKNKESKQRFSYSVKYQKYFKTMNKKEILGFDKRIGMFGKNFKELIPKDCKIRSKQWNIRWFYDPNTNRW